MPNTHYNNLPRLQIISSLSNIPMLSGPDVEKNLLNHVDFNDYPIPSFKSSTRVKQLISAPDSFSVLHSNIRSLSANHDELTTLLSDLNSKFSIIGLTETKIKIDRSLTSNINISGYQFISQPSHQNAGGVGFYIRDEYEFHCWDDLTTSTNDFECLSLQIHSQSHSNIICSVIYRHPNSNLANFNSYFTQIMDKISSEKKYCILMGDFNINLLILIM